MFGRLSAIFNPPTAQEQQDARDKIQQYQELISGWEAEREAVKASLPPKEHPIKTFMFDSHIRTYTKLISDFLFFWLTLLWLTNVAAYPFL